MGLSKQQIDSINKIITTAQKMIESSEPESSNGSGKTRMRRSSADAERMKAQIRAARAKGVAASKLAEKYGVSTAYVYMIK
jgi:hypothetical protein